MERLLFFGDFVQPILHNEITRIRAVTNDIIETQFGLPGSHKKDMSDFVMLDYIYRAAADRHSPRTFILFTGDGHFAPVVRHLVQDLRKNVILYGIRGSVSSFLKDAASECREFPDEEAQMRIYWQLIVDYFDEMAERRPNALLTFLRVANDVVRNGWFIQKKHVFPDRHAIKIVVPEWDKLIEAGLYKVKE